MRTLIVPFIILLSSCGAIMAAELKVDVNIMPRIVFTGDSQTCGCVGAWDYPQMLSWELPLRVFNRAVGGSNTTHLLYGFGGGTATVKQGEKVVHGENVGWYAGPYIGQRLHLGKQEYTLDSIETTDYAKHQANLHLTEPAREDFSGTDYAFEPGWQVRIAEVKPQYACFMYSVNDPGWKSEEFKARLAEITRRCREANIQPIFLTGVPMMAAEAGGSHPGTIERVLPRCQDMEEFCRQEKLPFGDVFRTLVKLDGQHTAEWVDTIHPTTDGSLPALQAVRYLLEHLGATRNPYYLRGYRAPDQALVDPASGGLQPIHTSQPRYDKDNKPNEAGFNLEARRLCDEYGLLAEPDGRMLKSDRPVLLRFGVGDADRITSAKLDLVTGGSVEVSLYDWQRRQWHETGSGSGAVACALSAQQLKSAWHEGAVWVGLAAPAIELDYAALTLNGDLEPFAPAQGQNGLVWPPAGLYDWPVSDNLIANGDLTAAGAKGPTGWAASGEGTGYVGGKPVASGNGDFCGDKRLDQFRCAGQEFTKTVRPLDMLEIADGPAGCTGNFLVCQVVDDEHLKLRRVAESAATGLAFRVRRSSGCGAVPGGCALEVKEESEWQLRVPAKKGDYRLGFFYRAFDPANMTAKARPTAKVVVRVGQGPASRQGTPSGQEPQVSYIWQRGWSPVRVARDGDLSITVSVAGPETMQYTGFSLTRGK